MRRTISTKHAPAAIGPYSQAVACTPREMVFCSGQIALDPATASIVEGGVEAQTEQVLKNLGAVLEAAGCSFADVVRTTVFLKDMNDFAAVNAIYATRFSEEPPARAAVEVARLPRDVLVEIDAIAIKR